jgi:hypothetical protein
MHRLLGSVESAFYRLLIVRRKGRGSLKESRNSMYPLSAETSDDSKPAKNWIQRLLSGQQRRAERLRLPPLVAYYWDGSAPIAHRIGDISESGIYLLTHERWYPRTLVMLTLDSSDDSEESIIVQAMVIRSDNDGVGLAFVPPEIYNSHRGQHLSANGADKATLHRYLRRLRISHA